ncbi:MAG: DUF1194 domain-containing protein [Pseudomonadota bacterium]
MLQRMRFAAFLLLMTIAQCHAQSTEYVDVELVIAVDVSGSMSDKEHNTQRQGFLTAFEDQQLIRTIQLGIRGRIAVTYIEWGNELSQRILVPWRIISDHASALAFRNELATKERSAISGTSISGAMRFAARLFENNGINSLKRVIDISGDGANRTGPLVDQMRDAVVGKGITINGLPIMLSPMIRRLTHGYGLNHYFEDCVIGGQSSFVFPVLRYDEFAEAIRRKLIIEISQNWPSADGQYVIHTSGKQNGESQLPERRAGRKADCQVGRIDQR